MIRSRSDWRPHAAGLLLAASAAGLVACAVGPDYTRPSVAAGESYGEAAAPQVLRPRDIPADWWTLFHHPALDALIAEALQHSPTLEAARQAVQVAQASREALEASFWPQLQASYSPARTKIAGNLGGNSPGVQGDGSVISTGSNTPKANGGSPPYNSPAIYNFHTAQVSVSYAPDVFGGNGRQVEASAALARAQQLEWQAARITLVANLVSAAILEGQLRQQLRAAEAAAEAATQALRLSERLRQAGHIAAQDEAGQRLAALAAEQQLPPLRQQLAQNRNLMRNLIGAAQDRELPAFELQDFRLPQALPLSLPSQLLEQRPDVRAAEEQLHAAVAQIGAARVARLPQFAITGNAGGAAAHLSQAFLASGRFFDLTATLTAPLFDAGAARHREQAAAAAAAQAQSQYRATALAAVQNVADVLRAIESAEASAILAEQSVRAARQSVDLARRRVAAGDLDRASALAAEITGYQADLQAAGAQAARLINAVALYQALGGGWWHTEPAASAPATHP
ncbi:MAG: efflux transporter outer membrane subunit [Burkholderiales bacterium]|nr:MAG: efflux transporter outer membrane subunit [Burkholderiales bacterium]